MTYPTRTIDAAEALLKSKGWSVGDVSFLDGDRVTWAVQCQRRDNTRFGYGDTQLSAWQQAVERCCHD